MPEIDPLTGLPVVEHTAKSPMKDLFAAAQQSGILDTLMQPQNSNVMAMLSQFRPQIDALPEAATAIGVPAGNTSATPNPLGGTWGVPWDQGREPYARNDVYRDPYNFDKSYWDQRAQMSAGFRQGLNSMPGVLNPLKDLTTGYPFFYPRTQEENKQQMYGGGSPLQPQAPSTPAPGAPAVDGQSIDPQLLLLLQQIVANPQMLTMLQGGGNIPPAPLNPPPRGRQGEGEWKWDAGMGAYQWILPTPDSTGGPGGQAV